MKTTAVEIQGKEYQIFPLSSLKGSIVAPNNEKVACGTYNEICHRWLDDTMCPSCFAFDRFRQYPNVQIRWIANYYAPIEEKETAIVDKLKRKRNKGFFRIHSSGEFTRDSLAMWSRIARRFPNTVFYSYSKEKWLGEYLGYLPGNLRIRWNTEINYGTMEELKDIMSANPGKHWVCPCGQPGADNKAICGKRCRACMLAPMDKLPLFIKH